jgi:hypothetical protein
VRALVVDEEAIVRLDPDLLSFRNINTEADWAEVQRLAGTRAGSGR